MIGYKCIENEWESKRTTALYRGPTGIWALGVLTGIWLYRLYTTGVLISMPVRIKELTQGKRSNALEVSVMDWRALPGLP